MSSSSTASETPPTAPIPKPPQPLYPDVPWWAVLITAFVFAAVGILFGVYGMKDMKGPAGLTLSGSSIAVDTISYIPHILLLFGVLADMFTLDGVWSIPSLIGILSIFANYVFQYFWKGIDELVSTGKNLSAKAMGNNGSTNTDTGAKAATVTGAASKKSPAEQAAEMMASGVSGGKRKQKGGADPLFKDYKGCTVQGFGGFSSTYAPQTLVVTATVFSYYCYDLIRNRGWINSIPAILAFFAAYIGEVAVIDFQNDTGCDEGKGAQAIPGGIRAFFEGLLFGGVGYGIVQTYAPTRLPSSTISPFPRKSAGDLSPGPDGKMYDADGYPYVILPNGQAVPDMSSAIAQSAFGGLAGTATGQTASLGSNCPASKATCAAATA
jgi:hypothetical protein